MFETLERRQLLSEPLHQPAPALFLDRDGVVIEDCHYLSDPDHVRLCPGVRQLIGIAKHFGWPVVLITNQSGISRGFFEWYHFDMVNLRMQELLGVKAPFAAIYANGHGPDAPASSWRKPSPGMLLDAAEALNIDLQRSLLIGDRLSDLQAGAAAGLECLFHVLSGHGKGSRKSVLQWQLQTPQPLPVLHLLDSLDSFPLELLNPHNRT